MKARSGRLGEFVMTVFLLVIGGAMIYGAAVEPLVGEVIVNLISIPIASGLFGAALIMAVVLRWVGCRCKPKDSFIQFTSEEGSVGISTKAIQDFIVRICKEFAAVRDLDVRLVKDRNALDLALNIKVVSGNRIPELSMVLQNRIRESVRESLGIDEIRNITIQVKEIVGDPAKHIETEDPQ